MNNFSVHKWLREIHLNENKGATMATDLISKIRSEIFPKLDNEELDTFKQYLADAFDMEVKEEDDKPKKEIIPIYKAVISYVEGTDRFYGMYVYETQESTYAKKLNYQQAKTLLDKYNVKPELPQFHDELNVQAIIDQLVNRGVPTYQVEFDPS